MTPQQQKQLEEVYKFMQSMKRFDTVPIEVKFALERKLKNANGIKVSDKAANSEDVSIDEGGSALHVVLDDPDLFLDITADNGTVYKIPAWTA